MITAEPPQPWQPVAQADRCEVLDVIRGVALLGVLLVNLLSDFRISLAEHILTFHTHTGWLDRFVDVLVAGVLEFKALTLFSLSFGVGVAVQAERAAQSGASVTRFLARRFLILLALGLIHMFLIWNGDILALYAVCGLLLLPLLRLPKGALAVLGGAAVFYPWDSWWPIELNLYGLAAEATRVYGEGSFAAILAFRWREAWVFIMPLLAAIMMKTLGLMLLGVAAWRGGLIREPQRHRALLWAIAVLGGAVGGTSTALLVWSKSTGRPAPLAFLPLEECSWVPLALAYAAGLLLWVRSPIPPAAAPFAAAGQMALTNYLTQSVILGIVFYSYGLGQFGRLGPAAAALIGLTLYAAQLALSQVWLRHFRFGPVEWLWRSVTYGYRQPFRREA